MMTRDEKKGGKEMKIITKSKQNINARVSGIQLKYIMLVFVLS